VLKVAPTEALDEELAKELRQELAKVEPALCEARKLAALPKGRYEVDWQRNLVATPLPHLRRVRNITLLLYLDAISALQERETDRALVSCRAAINAGRSIGDEPTTVSQLIRGASIRMALRALNRVLALTQVSAKSLAGIEQLLADEATQPLLLHGLRGERAEVLNDIGLIFAGEMMMEDISRDDDRRQCPSGWDACYYWAYVRPLARLNQAAHLEFMTQVIEDTKKEEPAEQRAAWEQFGTTIHTCKQSSPHLALAVLLTPDVHKLGEAHHGFRALQQSTRTALSVERYRLAHGRWPAQLDDLVPVFLPQVPRDPFGQGQLLYRRLKDGVVIYSVGANGTDEGGAVERESGEDPRDIGFRLWDADRRRQLVRREPANS
jgi:hypothetical protein